MRWVRLVLVLLLCAGCTESRINDDYDDYNYEGDEDLNLRPDDAPELVILSVSGHNLAWDLSGCADGFSYNCEYLWERGTLEAIGAVFAERGYGAMAWMYVDELYSQYDDTDGDGELGPNDEQLAIGFLRLLDDIDWLVDNWISDFINPTRVIVVAHSHGGVWAHSALMLKPKLPVDILVDLDTNALCWEDDLVCAFNGDNWRSEIYDYVDLYDPGWPFNVANASDSWSIPGLSADQDIEDLVPDSVNLNIEVRTDPILSPVYDNQSNHRLDGSRTSIYTEVIQGEDHADVTYPTSAAMEWVVAMIDWEYVWP